MKKTEKNISKKVAIFCGSLRLPLLVRDCLREKGFDIFVVGLKNFYDPKLNPDMVIRIGGGGAAARVCKRRNIHEMIFVGALGHPNLSDIRPDLWSLSILFRVLRNQKGYDNMATSLINGVEAKGFRVVAAQDYCPELVFTPGVHTKTKPTIADKKTIARAVHVSHVMGTEDIGQSVVVDKAVLAVEAAEGTANMFKRVIEIKSRAKTNKPSGVFAKMTKPGQDLRIDIPAIGVDTIRDVVAAKLRGIVVNAGTCFVIDRKELIATANKHKIFIVAV